MDLPISGAGRILSKKFTTVLHGKDKNPVEDHSEVLREKGDFGDEHVKIEDRLLICASKFKTSSFFSLDLLRAIPTLRAARMLTPRSKNAPLTW